MWYGKQYNRNRKSGYHLQIAVMLTEFLSPSHLFVTTLDLYPPSYVLKTAPQRSVLHMIVTVADKPST